MTEWSFFFRIFYCFHPSYLHFYDELAENFLHADNPHSICFTQKSWPNAYGYLWRVVQKISVRGQKWRSFRHNSSPNESIMTGPISKLLAFEVMAACKVWTKSNGWNAKSPYLPLLLGSYPLRHIFWARQRVPSRPRRLLVGYCPDHPAEARVPTTRWGLTVGTLFFEYNLFKLKIFWSMSIDVYIFAFESSTVLCSPSKEDYMTPNVFIVVWARCSSD